MSLMCTKHSTTGITVLALCRVVLVVIVTPSWLNRQVTLPRVIF